MESFLSTIPGLAELLVPARNLTGRHRPDFRFTEPVLINGKEVRWIEVKTYYGSGSLTSKTLPIGRISAQLKRYTDAFGPGAVLFGQGFHEELERRLNTLTCLDFIEETLPLVKLRTAE